MRPGPIVQPRKNCPPLRLLAIVLAAIAPIIALPACQKILAPNDSTITLTAANSTVFTSGSTAITAAVVDKSGNAVQDGTMVTFQTTLGSMNPTQVRTRQGHATSQFTAGRQQGTASVTASSGNNTSEPLTVTVSGSLGVTVTAQPTTAPINTAVTFTATATSTAGTGTPTIDHYDWDFGDGKTAVTTTGTTTHVYITTGTMTVKVTATAADGSTAVAQVEVVITLV